MKNILSILAVKNKCSEGSRGAFQQPSPQKSSTKPLALNRFPQPGRCRVSWDQGKILVPKQQGKRKPREYVKPSNCDAFSEEISEALQRALNK